MSVTKIFCNILQEYKLVRVLCRANYVTATLYFLHFGTLNPNMYHYTIKDLTDEAQVKQRKQRRREGKWSERVSKEVMGVSLDF